jgi:hypothetical protein
MATSAKVMGIGLIVGVVQFALAILALGGWTASSVTLLSSR